MNEKSNGNDWAWNKYQLITRFFGHVYVDLSIPKCQAKKYLETQIEKQYEIELLQTLGFHPILDTKSI